MHNERDDMPKPFSIRPKSAVIIDIKKIKADRIKEIATAIGQHVDQNMIEQIDKEWLVELNELISEFKPIKK